MKKLLVIFPLVFLLCFTLSCQNKAEKEELEKFRAQAQLEEQNKELASRFMDEAWGKANQAIVDELLADNFVLQDPPQDVVPTKEGYKQWVGMIGSIFTVVEAKIDDIFADGDKVVTRWTFISVLTSEFMGIPPSDNQIMMRGISIDRFENGKIVEEWLVMDQLGMMMQMGMELKPRVIEQ